MSFELSAVINLKDNFSATAIKCISLMEQMGKQSLQAAKHISDISKSAKNINKLSSAIKSAGKFVEKLGEGKDSLSPEVKNWINLMQQMKEQASKTSGSVSAITGTSANIEKTGNSFKKSKENIKVYGKEAIKFLNNAIDNTYSLAGKISGGLNVAGTAAKNFGQFASGFIKAPFLNSAIILAAFNLKISSSFNNAKNTVKNFAAGLPQSINNNIIQPLKNIGAQTANFLKHPITGVKEFAGTIRNSKQSIKDFGANIIKSTEGPAKFIAGLAGSIKKVSGTVKDAMAQIGSGTVSFLKGAIDSAAQSQKIDSELEQTIKSTGGAAGITAKQVGDMANSFSKTTEFSSDTIKQGQNVLLTFGSIGKDVLPKATQAMLDYAQKTGGNVVDASNKLGKALADPINSFSELSDVGVTLNDEQKSQIENFQKTGQAAKAQGVIIDALNQRVGGQAAAAAQTYDGTMKRLSNTMGNIKTSIGNALLPYVQKAADAFLGIANKIDKVPKPTMDLIAKVIGLVAVFGTLFGGTKAIQGALTALFPSLQGVTGAFSHLSLPIALVIAAIALLAVAYKKNLGGFKDFVDKAIKDVTKVFNSLVTWVKANWPKIQQIIQKVIVKVSSVMVSILKPVLAFALQIFKQIVTWVVKNWPLIKQTVSVVVNAISSLWNKHGATIIATVKLMWNIIKTYYSTAIKVVEGIIEIGMNIITGHWGAAFEGIINVVGTIFNGIKKIFSDLVNIAVIWGKDFLMGMANGIKGAVGFVVDAVSGVADKIRSFLHFTKPDQGPLADYETWMPDFMKGMSKGMLNSKSLIVKSTQDVAVGISSNMRPNQAKVNNTDGGRTAGTPNITINMGGVSVRQDSDIDKIATAIVSKLKITSLNMV